MVDITSIYGTDIITNSKISYVKELKNEFLLIHKNIFFDNLIVITNGIVVNNDEKLISKNKYYILIKPIVCDTHKECDNTI